MAGTLRALLLTTVLLVAVAPASAKDYTVGDSTGWTTGVDYTAWTKGKTFHVGDTLSFQYNAIHSVMEVSAADHGACSASNPLRSHKDQSTTIALTNPGTRYFICGTTGHCAAGMKLAVTVVSGGGSSSAPATTSTSTVRSMAKPTKPTGNGDPSSESDTASAADFTAAPGSSSSKLSSNTSGAACNGVRLAIVLLLVAMGLGGLMS
ncbi:hypothetical protein EJB05_38487 [Eragrostis curvula]|uniref:Phytocyanin domain-containing protein n=1 Tax=Eragrostis curvula TaxID=38414 RepID=A0A5J9TUF1_9POAL|nr:hypothetical protein EJB05_38487 [Eragrostis curvula]